MARYPVDAAVMGASEEGHGVSGYRISEGEFMWPGTEIGRDPPEPMPDYPGLLDAAEEFIAYLEDAAAVGEDPANTSELTDRLRKLSPRSWQALLYAERAMWRSVEKHGQPPEDVWVLVRGDFEPYPGEQMWHEYMREAIGATLAPGEYWRALPWKPRKPLPGETV